MAGNPSAWAGARVTLLERGTGNEVPRAVVFVEFRRYPDEGSVIALDQGLGR
jgi:hypothetical protein